MADRPTPRPSPRPPQPPAAPAAAASRRLEEPPGDGDEWQGEEIVDADLQGAGVDGLWVTACRLLRPRWSGAVVERLHLDDVVVTDGDLSGAVLAGLSARRVEFVGCRMTGAVLSDADLRHVVFQQCTLEDANLRFSRLDRVAFDGCVLAGADLTEATLVDVSFEECDLRRAVFHRAVAQRVKVGPGRVEDVVGVAGLRGAVVDASHVAALGLAALGELGILVG